MAGATPARRSVELFVRSLSPAETPASRHVDEVRGMAADGRVAAASVTVWGREIELSTTARRTRAGRCFLDRVADFRAWADDEGVSMAPFFETREVTASVTGEEYAALRLPVCCLAEYEDDDLVHVAPYSTGEAICTVADRIDRLGRSDGESDPTAPRRHSDSAATDPCASPAADAGASR